MRVLIMSKLQLKDTRSVIRNKLSDLSTESKVFKSMENSVLEFRKWRIMMKKM